MTPATPATAATFRPLAKESVLMFEGMTSTLHYAALAFHQRTMTLPRAFVIQREFAGIGDYRTLVPTGFEVCLQADLGEGGSLLAERGDCSLLIEWFGRGVHYVTVSANRLDEAEKWITLIRDDHPVVVDPDCVEMHTWRVNHGSPSSITGKIDAPTWSEVACNYSSTTRTAINSLAALDAPMGGPRLILWHGAPGTGKTSAIRALAREWSGWCELHVLAEPEAIMANPSYLEAAIRIGRPNNGASSTTKRSQRLVVMEDCDAVLGGRNEDVGPTLSRLLNSTDGLSEHGNQTLMLVTTNTAVHELHPALTRPGRCRAIVEFSPLTEAESNCWLPHGIEPVRGAHSLAELFVMAGLLDQIATEKQTRHPVGFV